MISGSWPSAPPCTKVVHTTHASFAMAAMSHADAGHAIVSAQPPNGTQKESHGVFGGASAQCARADADGEAVGGTAKTIFKARAYRGGKLHLSAAHCLVRLALPFSRRTRALCTAMYWLADDHCTCRDRSPAQAIARAYGCSEKYDAVNANNANAQDRTVTTANIARLMASKAVNIGLNELAFAQVVARPRSPGPSVPLPCLHIHI